MPHKHLPSLKVTLLLLTGSLFSAFIRPQLAQWPDTTLPQTEPQEHVVFIPLVSSLPASPPTEPDECFQVYAPTSIWNTPIDWSVARYHPSSGAMMDAFFQDSPSIGANTDTYTPPIYLVDNNTPLVQVTLREFRFRDAIDDVTIVYGEPGGTVGMPIPADAQPALGTDGQLAVINLDTGEEWGLNGGETLADGSWLVGGAYRYHIHNSGIPPEGFGQRGAGIGQVAGIIRPCEVARGRIGHAVTISYDYPCAPGNCENQGWPTVIPPFTRTDGSGWDQFDIPEGARLVIRPEITTSQIETACHGVLGCLAWVKNMQSYGGFIVDQAGHPKTYAEGNATANWDPQVWFADMLRDIPTSWYAVLDWNYPSTSP